MSSILTNNGAMVALQTLKSINKDMGKVQSEVSTGLKVATAKDNSSSWSIASTMKSDVSSLRKVNEGIASANAMVGVARSASEQVAGLLTQIQEKAVQAQQPDADTTKIQAEVDALTAAITDVADAAQYNGINLVKATAATVVTTGVNRSTTGAVTAQTISIAALTTTLDGLGGAAGTYDVTASGILDTLDTALDDANTAASNYGAIQQRLEVQSEFVSKQADALKSGVGALVDADMEEASARLQALQVQQQLGVQALSIANQAPQSVLSLFR